MDPAQEHRTQPSDTVVSRRTAISALLGGSFLNSIPQTGTADTGSPIISQAGVDDYNLAWHTTLGANTTQPVRHNDSIVVGDSDGNVFSYNIKSGDIDFQTNIDASISKYCIGATGSTVVVGHDSNEVLFFDTSSQKVRERFLLGGPPVSVTTLGRHAFVFDESGTVRKFDTGNDELLWDNKVTDRKIRNPQTILATSQGLLLLAKAEVILVNPTDGEVIKRIGQESTWAGALRGWRGTLSNDGHTAYVVETFRSNALHIVNLDAHTTRKIKFSESGACTCGPTNGLFFAGGGGQGIYAVNESTGNIEWEIGFRATGLSHDVFGEQLIMIGRQDGQVVFQSVDINGPTVNWRVDEALNDLITTGTQNYEFTKPVKIGDYYAVTASSGDNNWVASFGPKSDIESQASSVESNPTASLNTEGTASGGSDQGDNEQNSLGNDQTNEGTGERTSSGSGSDPIRLAILGLTALGVWYARKQYKNM